MPQREPYRGPTLADATRLLHRKTADAARVRALARQHRAVATTLRRVMLDCNTRTRRLVQKLDDLGERLQNALALVVGEEAAMQIVNANEFNVGWEPHWCVSNSGTWELPLRKPRHRPRKEGRRAARK